MVSAHQRSVRVQSVAGCSSPHPSPLLVECELAGSVHMDPPCCLVPHFGACRCDAGFRSQMVSSGSYSCGFACVTSKDVPPGRYTIIVSSFKPCATGPVSVVVGSSRGKVKVESLTGDGGYTKQVCTSWHVTQTQLSSPERRFLTKQRFCRVASACAEGGRGVVAGGRHRCRLRKARRVRQEPTTAVDVDG